ncbi:hypothetical protein [Variovorax sp. 3P27G3]|jgi:hypothetical protein|uniref:hypothetical protein n=1 Tax=Variovorax sp. 3P27G3 TaxID=2502214 RepID=UPI0010F9EFA9|nr:hypothetical protein [Variovorax sp. 3P27G3]
MSKLSKAQQVNAVALAMQPLLGGIDAAVTRLIGHQQHNIVLVIGCAGVSQYAANVPRPAGVQLLKDLFARWHFGMDDVLPGGVTPGDTQAFEYLLNKLEEAAKAPEPEKLDYANRRIELLNYVGRIEAKARRS